MSDYGHVSRHRSMAQDAVRNSAYARALARVITPDSIVLDLGAGTGLLGIVAAKLGARRVYLVEPEDILEVAAEIVVANGLQDRVMCLRGRIEDVKLPERVTVIVSVLTGNFMVTEDLLASLCYAREHVLMPGGALVPRAATMMAVPVSAPALHEKHVARWSEPQQGVNLSAARPYAANTVYYEPDALRDATCLAAPLTLWTMDFTRDAYGPIHATQTFEVTGGGVCHGWAGWTDIDLGGEWLSTSPFAPKVHWSSAFLPIDPPLPLATGDLVTLELDRAPRGDWTWATEIGGVRRQHSTLLGSPLNVETLRRAAPSYRPVLNDEGRAMLELLRSIDGRADAAALMRHLQHSTPVRWSADDRQRFLRHALSMFTTSAP